MMDRREQLAQEIVKKLSVMSISLKSTWGIPDAEACLLDPDYGPKRLKNLAIELRVAKDWLVECERAVSELRRLEGGDNE